MSKTLYKILYQLSLLFVQGYMVNEEVEERQNNL